MRLYYWIMGVFGVSGWLFSLYLWKTYRRVSDKRRETSSQKKAPKSQRASAAVPGVRPDTPRTMVRQPDAKVLSGRDTTHDDSLHAEAAYGKIKILLSGRSKYVVGCLALLVMVAIVYLLSGRSDKNSNIKVAGEVSPTIEVKFIEINSSQNILTEPPDWRTTTVKTGENGEGIEVVIGVLWDPYRWVKGDVQYVAIDETEKVTNKIEDVIKTFRNNETRPIIVVGMASHENARENPEEEIHRAADRTDRLVDVCSKHFINKPHLYSLNLGAYRPDRNPSKFSASERRVVLLVINSGENHPNLSAEVKKALIKAKVEQKFMFDARDYSLFDDRFEVNSRSN